MRPTLDCRSERRWGKPKFFDFVHEFLANQAPHPLGEHEPYIWAPVGAIDDVRLKIDSSRPAKRRNTGLQILIPDDFDRRLRTAEVQPAGLGPPTRSCMALD